MAVSQHPAHYTFSSSGLTPVRVLAGEGGPVINEGYGGFEVVNRPRKVGFPQWTGYQPITMSIPIYFNAFDGGDVEQDIANLLRMARDPSRAAAPPVISITALGSLQPYPNLKWVISSLEFGDAYRDDLGNRIRQACTVNVFQNIDPVEFDNKNLRKSLAKHAPIVHVVKKGQTLKRIVMIHRSKLPGKNLKAKIKRAKDVNNIKDETKKLNPGRRIYLPRD